jgi:hypothetical protein
MKKTSILIAFIAMFLIFACQKDGTTENGSIVSTAEQQNWQTAKLDAKFADSQKQVTAYLFSTDEMSKLVQTPNVENVQFVLGYSDNTLQIKVIGVDKSGNELASVDSEILKENGYADKLAALNVSKNKANKGVNLLDEHLLFPKEAFDGITAWQEKLNTLSDIDEVLSYEGKRFKHFSLEAGIVADLLKNKNATNIGLFLGLNPVGKVTTILIGLDKNNSIKKGSFLTGKVEDVPDDVYDGARPSPPY